MTRKVKTSRAKVKRRGLCSTAPMPEALVASQPADGLEDDAVLADSPDESDAAIRADIERADEHSLEPVEGVVEAGSDDSTTGIVEAATADPAQAQAPPHLIET